MHATTVVPVQRRSVRHAAAVVLALGLLGGAATSLTDEPAGGETLSRTLNKVEETGSF
jgi:hypothetical protein